MSRRWQTNIDWGEYANDHASKDVCPFRGRGRARSRRSWSLVLGLSLAPMAVSADVGNATTIASGLANPRGIGFAPNGALYVAEAGSGGPGPCIPSPVFPNPLRCYGETGALTRIMPNVGFQRVVTGLPSLVLGNGTVEGGPVDVSFLGTAPAVVIGLGGDPAAVRAALPPKGALLGTLLHATPSGAYKVVADIAGVRDCGQSGRRPHRFQPVRRACAARATHRGRCGRQLHHRGAGERPHADLRRPGRSRRPDRADVRGRRPGRCDLCGPADRLPVLPGRGVGVPDLERRRKHHALRERVHGHRRHHVRRRRCTVRARSRARTGRSVPAATAARPRPRRSAA